MIGSIIATIGSLIGGGMQAAESRRAQDAAIAEARRAEAFNLSESRRAEELSLAEARRGEVRADSYIQRLAADARAAGISPLAAMGAGSQSGPMASPVPSSAVSPSYEANTAAGDAVGRGASIIAEAMSDRTKLENKLLEAQIGLTNVQAADVLAQARSRTMIASARAASVGGAVPRSTTLVLPPGVPFPTSATSSAQDVQDQYGDIVENVYGIGRLAHDTWNNVGGKMPWQVKESRPTRGPIQKWR